MLDKIENRIDISFQNRQLLIGDLTYILNKLTSIFRHAVSLYNDKNSIMLNKDEYVLRLSKMRHENTTVMELKVAATKKSVALSSPQEISNLRMGLTEMFFNLMINDDDFKKVESFRKSIEKKAPRIYNFSVRLVSMFDNGEEKIEGDQQF